MLASVAAGGAASVAGCASSGAIWGRSTDESVTLEYLDVAGARSADTFEPVVSELDAAVELQFTEVPYETFRSTLKTRVGGGNPPDVAAIDQIWLGDFIDAGAVVELDAVVGDLDLGDYLDPFVEPGRADGHVYALPTTTDVRGMYWNRDAFAASGLDPESPPATWEELLDAAEAVHDPPERYGAAYFVNGGRWTVNLFAAGGDVLSADGSEPRFHERPGVAAARFVDELYNGRGVGAPEPRYQNAAQVAREFLQGRYGIAVVEGSWLDHYWQNLGGDPDRMPHRFGFAPTPAPSDGQPATMSGGHMWTALAGSDHPELARDFIRAASRPDRLREVAVEARQIPTRESLLDDSAVWREVLYDETIRDLLAETRLRPTRNWSVVADALDPALQRVAFDRADPAAALRSAAADVESALR